MIDKRKAWIAGATILALLTAIVVLIVGGLHVAHRQAPAAGQPATASASPSLTTVSPESRAGEDSPSQGAYDNMIVSTDITTLASQAGVAASSWDASQSVQARRRAYTAAGFSPDLARTYTPIWASIFGDNKTAKITTKADGHPGINTVNGQAGHRQLRLGVTIIYQGSWNDHGTPRAQQAATATWWLTIDEASHQVTKIEQPDPNALQIRLTNKH